MYVSHSEPETSPTNSRDKEPNNPEHKPHILEQNPNDPEPKLQQPRPTSPGRRRREAFYCEVPGERNSSSSIITDSRFCEAWSDVSGFLDRNGGSEKSQKESIHPVDQGNPYGVSSPCPADPIKPLSVQTGTTNPDHPAPASPTTFARLKGLPLQQPLLPASSAKKAEESTSGPENRTGPHGHGACNPSGPVNSSPPVTDATVSGSNGRAGVEGKNETTDSLTSISSMLANIANTSPAAAATGCAIDTSLLGTSLLGTRRSTSKRHSATRRVVSTVQQYDVAYSESNSRTPSRPSTPAFTTRLQGLTQN